MLSDLMLRLRAIFRRNRVESDVEQELQFHITRQVEAFVKSGLTREEAMRRARLRFGGLDQVKEECREARGVAFIETTLQDLRYAIRGMRRNPGFTMTAVLTLALATGAISTVFHLANTFFFRRLPANRPQELVVVTATRRQGRVLGYVSYPEYVRFRDRNKTLQGLAAHYSTAPLFVTANNNSKEINGAVVSADFFPLLGVKPALGRFFRQDEDSVPDRDRVAVLGYELWQNWFGSSQDALGATVRINGVGFTVIGVAPAAFHGLNSNPSQIYLPLMQLRVGYRGCDDSLAADCTMLSMIGRLAEGRTVEEAHAEMATLAPPNWQRAVEGDNSGVVVSSQQGADRADNERRFVKLLALVAVLLMLVACANLGGMLIARGSARTREFTIRISMGAARLRLVRLLLTEALLLALSGGLLGTLLSLAMTDRLSSTFYSMDPEGHPLYYAFSPQPLVILAVFGVSVAAGLLFGLIPAIRSSYLGAGNSLKAQTSAVSASSRLGHCLVGTQAAIAVALVAVAALLMASAHLLATGTNFESSHVALMRLRPRLLKYPPDRAQQFMHNAIRRLEAVPGVESVSMVGSGVVLGGSFSAVVKLPEWPERQTLSCGFIDIGPRYFETLRTPLLRGREFDERDSVKSPPVAIVNETLARHLWPSGAVIGATLVVGGRSHQVIGIVEDVPLENRTEQSRPYVFTAYWQNAGKVDARLCVRVKGDPAPMLPLLTREVNQVDPDVPIAETITLPLQIAGTFRPLRVSAMFLACAAGFAVLLSAIGVYGALAFAVSRRTKEIGVRMAIGADSRGVLGMILREGMTVILTGLVAGLGLAVAGTRLVRHLLFGSATNDAVFYVAAALLVASTGLFACWVPARRAASVEPLVALREE